MQTSNAKQDFRSNDPAWVLLAELLLSDFLSDHDRRDGHTAGALFQTGRELGMSPECMENIARTLAEFARAALVRTKQGRLKLPGWIRIFGQRKILDDASSKIPSKPYHTEQAMKHAQIFPDSWANRVGGWGYFMIKRGADFPPDSSAIPHSSIDLYLYKEG